MGGGYGMGCGGATGGRQRLPATPGGWVLTSSREGRRLHMRDVPPDVMLICPGAESPDDLNHRITRFGAGSPPGKGTMRAFFVCLCNRNKYDDEMKVVPVPKRRAS